ncbi:hypothetical protein EAH87_04125 [Sphingomonas koreensis]|nr:hypothetical protein EAH87_04125 [Sphingomonas koreensis]
MQAAIAPPALPLILPTDWSVLPPLTYRQPPTVTPAMDGFVANEIAANRCSIARPTDGHYTVRLDIAVLVGEDDHVRQAVPRAIQCPTVEQYGAGLVMGFARNNLPPRIGRGDKWFQTTIIFDWQG